MSSTIKYIYNLYKKLQTGCNSTEVLNSVEKQKDEIVVSVTSDVQEVNETTTKRTRANTMYEETKTSINENVEKIVTENIEQLVPQGIEVIDAIQTTLTEVQLEPIQEPVVKPPPESIAEDQQSEYSSIHSPPPSPEYSYTDYQTEIIGVVVDTDESSIINSSYNKFI